MPVQKPAKHGRDHSPGGEDPIPYPRGIAEHIKVFEDIETVLAGDGAFYFGCARDFDAYLLSDVEIDVSTVSSSGIVQVQIHNLTQAVDMLSTRVQIDANETHSRTSSVSAVINAANAEVAHGDIIRIDVDAAGTGAKGLAVVLKFYAPTAFLLQGPIGLTGNQGEQGIQGPQGDPGGVTNWLGPWVTSFAYSADDAVSHNGSSYICLTGHTSGASSEPGVGGSWQTYWMVLAAKGDTGSTGATGPTGPANPHIIEIKCFPDSGVGSDVVTGDSRAVLVIPPDLNGADLISAHAWVSTVSSSGLPTVQIRNVTQAADMLSTRITIDVSEYTSYSALTPPVIDITNDDVATADLIAVDIDVAGTGTKGLGVVLTFAVPA